MARKTASAAGSPALPETLAPYLDAHFGGLFGTSPPARVIEALIADPHAVFCQDDIEDLAEVSKPAAREALRTLMRLRLVLTGQDACGETVYTVDRTSRLFVALALLAYGIVDDREGTDTMATAIRDLRSGAGSDRKRKQARPASSVGLHRTRNRAACS